MGEKGKTLGEIGKILASEASLVVVWEGLPRGSLCSPIFFLANPEGFLNFPPMQSLGPD